MTKRCRPKTRSATAATHPLSHVNMTRHVAMGHVTYQRVMWLICMRRVTCHMCMSHVTYGACVVMSHVTTCPNSRPSLRSRTATKHPLWAMPHMHESCDTCMNYITRGCVCVCHVWMSHVTYQNLPQFVPLIALQGDRATEDLQDALICSSFSEQEPLIIGLFCGKWPVRKGHPVGLGHPVANCFSAPIVSHVTRAWVISHRNEPYRVWACHFTYGCVMSLMRTCSVDVSCHIWETCSNLSVCAHELLLDTQKHRSLLKKSPRKKTVFCKRDPRLATRHPLWVLSHMHASFHVWGGYH